MKTNNQFTAKEWNAGGAFQFYGSRKPRCYIVEVTTTNHIDGALLQKAVNLALERMPYYLQTFVRKKGLYYYAESFLKSLDGLDIPYETLPSDTYLNPEVELPPEQGR